jgi:hypothetical protein
VAAWDDARYFAFLANTHAGIVRRMEFTYRLTGKGWAEARIADGTSQAVITASYLSDALGDLLEALGTMLEGAGEARCSWEEEPGEYRWIFAREDRDQVTLRILEFADMYARPDTRAGVVRLALRPDEEGELRFSTTQPVTVLAQAIADGAAAALAEYGEAGYQAKWLEAPFPVAHLEMIRGYLGAEWN